MKKLSIDVESRSRVDLISHGAYVYWSDPSTEVICMAYALEDEDPNLWVPGDPVPSVFFDPDVEFRAWNAPFERLAFDYYLTPEHGFPYVPLERWRCTMFASRANNMPGALGNAARCLHTTVQKQAIGSSLIKQLCIPQPDGSFNEDPELFAQLCDYCIDDVRTERAIVRQLREPSEEEWQDWIVTERLNDRGVRIDYDLCVAAQEYAKEEETDLIARMVELTEGAVRSVRGEGLKNWVLGRIPDEAKSLIKRYQDGEEKYSLDKYNRGRLIDSGLLDEVTKEVIECSDAAQKSSVGKFRAMQRTADPYDHRVRGVFIANGGSQTGRHSSKSIQLQNFPRNCAKDPVAVRADLIDGVLAEDITDYFGGTVMGILSSMLRPAIIPSEGCLLVDADYAGLENRIAAWLVGADTRLAAFRNGEDLYVRAAAGIYNVEEDEVTKDQRQVGKVAELALTYGGGAKAFNAMARGYGVDLSEAEVENIKHAWRKANPEYTTAWVELERAFIQAFYHPGKVYQVGRVAYVSAENVLVGGSTVFCILPDDRLLTYPDVRVTLDDQDRPQISQLRASWAPKAKEKEWPRAHLWGGHLLENLCQAVASSVLRWLLRELDARNVPVVACIHDQVVADTPVADVERVKADIHELMNTSPQWAEGLPLTAEVEVLERFAK